jgi:hypothetical protein
MLIWARYWVTLPLLSLSSPFCLGCLFGAVGFAATPFAVFPEAGNTPSLFHRELGSLLNIDDDTGLACLAVEQRELSGMSPSQQRSSRIALRISRAVNDQFAAADYAVAIPIMPPRPIWDGAWPLESSFVVLGHAAKVAGATTLGRRGAEPAHPAAGVMVLMEFGPAPELPLATARADTAGDALGIVRG